MIRVELHLLTVYAAQPREGTETPPRHPSNRRKEKVYAAQPREGTETEHRNYPITNQMTRVYAAQPREGTETL